MAIRHVTFNGTTGGKMYKSARLSLTAIALFTAIGCGDDDGSGPEGSIAVTASPTALTVPQGGSGTVTVTLTRGGGFAEAVNVTVEGLPAGVTASVSPAQLTGTTTSATITVNVANTVAAGTYTATVRASATGVGAATATYTLTVTALPNYALSATPAAVSVGQGGSGTTTIAIQRTNFTGPVTLTLDGPPAGITGSFNPTPATADQSVLTINVASTVATGNYNLTVKGSATGPGDKTTTVAVTVGPPPDYSLSATPSSLTINAGGNAQTTVNITRTNFTGAVALSLDAPPAGITATFNPAAPTGATSTATINVASTVAPGTYNVTIKGTASGVPTFTVAGVIDEAAAAGDRTTTVAITVAPAPNFTIAASPNALSIAPGATGNSSVTIVRTNLTSDIALTLASPPPGITGVFTPATLTGTTLTSALVLSVASTVAPGTYPVTVQGVGGSLTKTAVVTVTVVAGPSVVLSLTPATLTIEQGSSGQTTLNAARSNYTGTITPSTSGNPAGMTLTFNPNPLTANSAAVTVNVGSGVAPATYNVVITGASGAAGNPTVTLPVTVTAPSGGAIVWEFCSTDPLPLKFWRLSGGTWAEVAPTVGTVNRFSFTISSVQGGVAFTVSQTGSMVRSSARMTQRSSMLRDLAKRTRARALDARARITGQSVSLTFPYYDTFVLLALTSELSDFRETCATAPTLVSKTFNVTGQGAGEEGLLGYGGAAAALVPQTTAYNVMVEAGTYDWLAMFGPAPNLPDFTHNWSHYRIGRGEAAPGAAVSIDRVGATAFTSTPFTVTGGAAGSFYLFSQSLEGARGAIIGFPIGSLAGQTAGGNMLFVAPGDRLSTDMNALNIANQSESGNVIDFRTAIRYLGSAPPATTTFALPQSVPAFTVAPVNGAPVPTWSASGQTPTDYQTSTSLIEASFQGAGETTLFTVGATRAWLTANGFSTSYTLTSPTLPGFLAQWAPAAPLVDAQVVMFGSNITTTPVAGSVVNIGFRLVQSP